MTDVSFDLDARGTINDAAFAATGEGRADPETGVVEFGAAFDPVPEAASVSGALLSVLIIPTTGFGRPEGGSTNLVSLTASGFDFVQEVSGEQVSLQAEGSFRREGSRDHFTWSAQADGWVDLSEIASVADFSAVMVPDGPGAMIEVMEIPLVTAAGRTAVNIVRRFSFDETVALPALQSRRMSLTLHDRKVRADVSIQADIAPFHRQRRI